MALASLSDLKRLLDTAPQRGKPRITIGGTQATLSNEAAQAFLDGQEEYVYAKLGFVPDPNNALVKEIHGKLTAFHIWIHIVDRSHGEGEIPEYVMEWKTWAEQCLQDARDGNLDLPRASDAIPLRAASSEFVQVWDDTVTMKSNEWVKLKYFPMIANSEICYQDKDKGGTQYLKDVDYKINYAQCEVMALTGGYASIADEQEVYFSYQHVQSRLISKRPERVEDADRSGIPPDWSGLFGSGQIE